MSRNAVLFLTLLLLILAPIARQTAVSQIRLPALRGFVEVEPGAAFAPPDSTPPAHPSGLSLTAETYEKTERQGVQVRRNGRVRADAITPTGQLLFFDSDGEPKPVAIRLKVPFDLRDLFPQPVEGELRYASRFAFYEHERTLTLALAGGQRFQVIEAGGMEPLALDATNTRDIDLGIRGLAVRQGPAAASTDDPSHDYAYPVPVEIETADGTVTSLWQGQWVLLPSGRQDQSLCLAVLSSEVARADSSSAGDVLERAPFDLQLLLVSQSR